MTMNRKSLVVLLLVAVFLTAAYFASGALSKWYSKSSSEKNSLKITDISSSDVSRISYTGEEGTVSFYKKSGKWYCKGDSSLKVDQDTVTETAEAFSQLSGTRKISDPDELKDYGLDKPAYTVTVTGKDDEKCKLKIGDITGNEYYLTADGGKTVYTVESSVADKLLFDKSSFSSE